jgi:hypothetical protein
VELVGVDSCKLISVALVGLEKCGRFWNRLFLHQLPVILASHAAAIQRMDLGRDGIVWHLTACLSNDPFKDRLDPLILLGCIDALDLLELGSKAFVQSLEVLSTFFVLRLGQLLEIFLSLFLVFDPKSLNLRSDRGFHILLLLFCVLSKRLCLVLCGYDLLNQVCLIQANPSFSET